MEVYAFVDKSSSRKFFEFKPGKSKIPILLVES